MPLPSNLRKEALRVSRYVTIANEDNYDEAYQLNLKEIIQFGENCTNSTLVVYEKLVPKKVLSDMIKWLDSEELKRVLMRSASLSITHPHLSTPVSPEFAAFAAETLAAFRKACE